MESVDTEDLDLDESDLIEDHLIKSEFPFEKVDEGFWLIHDEFDQIDNIVVYHSPPVVTFRVKLLEVPDLDDETRLRLFQKLLELNATSMVAGAYGLEDDSVVAIDSLQAENLDFNEFQASIDSMALAIREHYRPLRRLIRGDEEGDGEFDEQFASLDEALEQTESLGEASLEDEALDEEIIEAAENAAAEETTS